MYFPHYILDFISFVAYFLFIILYLQNINGSFVVNPDRLAKGSAGGTFARLSIKPVVDEDKSLSKSICAQVVRI